MMRSAAYFSERSEWGRIGAHLSAQFYDLTYMSQFSRGDVETPPLGHMPPVDLIISFKSDLKLPQFVLERAEIECLNIHPGPPHYRGVNGYHLAIQNKDTVYGVTAHRMNVTLDSGPIFDFLPVPIVENDSVSSLKTRTSVYALQLLERCLNKLPHGTLQENGMKWHGKLWTYEDFKNK